MTARRWPVAAGALAAGCAAALAGCSGPTTTASTTTRLVPPSTSVPTSTAVGGPGTTTTTFDAPTNARPDVAAAFPACRRDAAGTWTWAGTVTNKTRATHTYTIVVDFTDAAATVEDTKTTEVRALAAGQTARWTVTGAPGRSGVTCVIRSARIS